MTPIDFSTLSFSGCLLVALLIVLGIAAAFVLFHWGNPPRR